MYPEKGPVFSQTTPTFKLKWLQLFAMSQVVRLMVQRFYFDIREVISATQTSTWKKHNTDEFAVKNSSHARRPSSLMIKAFLLALDVIAGVFVVSIAVGADGELCAAVFRSCLELLRSGVFNLTGTLEWLMDNPAGLKLNKELAYTLGAFFKHHISLWQMYINYLTSLLQGGDIILCSFGCLGLSFFGALVVDCISLFTVHVHCFYIYMARLFNLQLRGLLALGRFFTGKKWNPLRERVDHVTNSVDQLFVGSLIMMVAVFLLPTTVTFYFVFATLHVLVKIAQLPCIFLSRWIEIMTGSTDDFVYLPDGASPGSPGVESRISSVMSICRAFFLGEIF